MEEKYQRDISKLKALKLVNTSLRIDEKTKPVIDDISRQNELFITKAMSIVEANLSNEDFTTEILAQKPEVHLVDTMIAPREDFPFDRVIGGRNYKWRVRTEKEIFYRFGDRTIWGLTARLLHAFAKTWGVTYSREDNK